MIGPLLESLGLRTPAWRADWTSQQLGAWGERIVADYFWRRRGAAVLARNWHGGGGELDLVVREGEALVFVEIKTRSSAGEEPLTIARDPRRVRHFRSAARAYRDRLPFPRPEMRFDVVLVTPRPAAPADPAIEHFVDVLSNSAGTDQPTTSA